MTKKNKPKSSGSKGGFVLTAIILFVIWLLLSGKFDLFHITFGVICSLMVAYFSSDLIFPTLNIRKVIIEWPQFILYIPWLLYQVFLANFHVMYLVFHPRMMELIDPGIIRFRSRLKSEIALTTFANSITLTPGTITVYVTDYGEFEVHIIDQVSGQALPGEMEAKIERIFRTNG